MRYLTLFLVAILLLTLPTAASGMSSATRTATHAASVQQPLVAIKARFDRAADRITTKILQLLPPAFVPAPEGENIDAPMNKMANISFYCGIAGYLGIYPALPVALVTGIIALNQIRDSGEQGKSRAIAGVVMGGAPFAVAILVFAWMNGQ